MLTRSVSYFSKALCSLLTSFGTFQQLNLLLLHSSCPSVLIRCTQSSVSAARFICLHFDKTYIRLKILLPGERTYRYPLSRKLGGSKNRSGPLKKRASLVHAGIRTSDHKNSVVCHYAVQFCLFLLHCKRSTWFLIKDTALLRSC